MKQTGQAVSLINSLASQPNLLALNVTTSGVLDAAFSLISGRDRAAKRPDSWERRPFWMAGRSALLTYLQRRALSDIEDGIWFDADVRARPIEAKPPVVITVPLLPLQRHLQGCGLSASFAASGRAKT